MPPRLGGCHYCPMILIWKTIEVHALCISWDDSQEPGHVLSVGFDGHTCCYLVLMPPATNLPCQMLGLGGDKSDEAAAIL